MEGASVDELLEALKPLVKARSTTPVVLVQPGFGNEPLTHVSVRSYRGAMVDLYSGTSGTEHTVETLARELARAKAQGGGGFEVFVFHPDHGDEAVQEIALVDDHVLLSTDYQGVAHG